MSFVDNELEAGEDIIFKINRGRSFRHYQEVIARDVMGLPGMAFFVSRYLSNLFDDFPQPTSVDPFLVQMLVPTCLFSIIFVPSLALVVVSLLDLIHFLMDELALTNKRIIGRGQARMIFPFQIIDIRLSDVVDIKNKNTFLEIQVAGESPVVVSTLFQNEEFVRNFIIQRSGSYRIVQ